MSYVIAHENSLILQETLEAARKDAGLRHNTQLYKQGRCTPIAVYELRLVEWINPVLETLPEGGTFA